MNDSQFVSSNTDADISQIKNSCSMKQKLAVNHEYKKTTTQQTTTQQTNLTHAHKVKTWPAQWNLQYSFSSSHVCVPVEYKFGFWISTCIIQ